MAPPGFRLSAATGLHKGDRQYQQDQVALISHARVNGCVLAIVADGMGGRSGGRKAADQVLLTARQLFERFDPHSDDASSSLNRIILEAHAVIKLTAIAAEQEPHSTVAAFLLNPAGDCYWAHCGDSRIYHFEGQELVQRTLDHSYVQALVQRGQISSEEALKHPKANLLLSCLGGEKEPTIANHYIPSLSVNATLMACSDGLWHYFDEHELGTALATLAPREASEFLLEKARSRAQGRADNISLVIVKIEARR